MNANRKNQTTGLITSVYKIGESEIFYCNRFGSRGRGVLLDEKSFMILKGSVGRKECATSCREGIERLRDQLIESDDVKVQGNLLVVHRDCEFTSPSMAVQFLTGYNKDGLDVWENDKGETLKTVLEKRRASLVEPERAQVVRDEIFLCDHSDTNGRGILLENMHFRVLKGSRGRTKTVHSCRDHIRIKRKQLEESGLILDCGPYFIMQEDYDFATPSAAAQFLTGSNKNGLDLWRNGRGETLKSVVTRDGFR